MLSKSEEFLKKKILICEDNPMAMRTLTVILEREGFDVDIAGDGNRAIELLNKNDYDLLVMDIHLPYHSGLELVKYVRSDQGKDTPAIVLTAFSDLQMQRQAGELGISAYVVKPFNPTEFIAKIKSIFDS
jgi:DNA-binding response OmpR family regulator